MQRLPWRLPLTSSYPFNVYIDIIQQDVYVVNGFLKFFPKILLFLLTSQITPAIWELFIANSLNISIDDLAGKLGSY